MYCYQKTGVEHWTNTPDDLWETVCHTFYAPIRLGERVIDGSRMVIFCDKRDGARMTYHAVLPQNAHEVTP